MASRRRPRSFPRGRAPAILAASVLLASAATCLASGSASVAVSASILSQSNCRFRSNGPAPALAFGTLDPSSPLDANATATLEFRCMGSAPQASFVITDDDGLAESGPDANRMRHATLPLQFLPYRFSYTPASGTVNKNVWTSLTIRGTVLSADFRNAAAGNYSDTVVLTIQP